jgi:hypothetical protein
MIYRLNGDIEEAVAKYGDVPLRLTTVEGGETYVFEGPAGECKVSILPFADSDIAELLVEEYLTLRMFGDVLKKPRLCRYQAVAVTAPGLRVRIERASRIDNIIEETPDQLSS